jgi:hypothetical protein
MPLLSQRHEVTRKDGFEPADAGSFLGLFWGPGLTRVMSRDESVLGARTTHPAGAFPQIKFLATPGESGCTRTGADPSLENR